MKLQVKDCTPPEGTLIAAYGDALGHHTDCFSCTVTGQVDLGAFVQAFYKTPLFRAERFVLRVASRCPSTDDEVDALAAGTSERFAAWRVEARRPCEMILADTSGRTKSWFHVAAGTDTTELRFGSVVVPVPRKRDGKLVLGPVFDSLLGAHLVYSRALLGSAAKRLS